MTTMKSKLCRGALVAAALVAAPVVLAGAPSVTPEQQRALAKAEEGPDALRLYVYRTRMIYAHDINEIIALREAIRTAEAQPGVTVAAAPAR